METTKTKKAKALKLYIVEYGQSPGETGDCEVFTVLDPNFPAAHIPPSYYLCRGQWRKGYIDYEAYLKKGSS